MDLAKKVTEEELLQRKKTAINPVAQVWLPQNGIFLLAYIYVHRK